MEEHQRAKKKFGLFCSDGKYQISLIYGDRGLLDFDRVFTVALKQILNHW